jgi:hypothetical protein
MLNQMRTNIMTTRCNEQILYTANHPIRILDYHRGVVSYFLKEGYAPSKYLHGFRVYLIEGTDLIAIDPVSCNDLAINRYYLDFFDSRVIRINFFEEPSYSDEKDCNIVINGLKYLIDVKPLPLETILPIRLGDSLWPYMCMADDITLGQYLITRPKPDSMLNTDYFRTLIDINRKIYQVGRNAYSDVPKELQELFELKGNIWTTKYNSLVALCLKMPSDMTYERVASYLYSSHLRRKLM